MAPVTLPPSFYNSFWSPDYRSGLTTLFDGLDRGLLEDDYITEFIESQVRGHQTLANTLLNPPLFSSSNGQTSSSLQHTLLSLQGASSARGESHKLLADELQHRLLAGFSQWKERHEVRVRAARDEFLSKTGVVGVWEKEVSRLTTLRATYQNKMRLADESEDDARFATPLPHGSPDPYTSSPKMLQHANLRRSGTVSDRISEKLRQASAHKPLPKQLVIEGKTLPPPPSPLRPASPAGSVDGSSSPTREDAFIPPSEPDGKPSLPDKTGPERMSTIPLTPVDTQLPRPILLSGLSLAPSVLKETLQRFDTYLLTTPAPYSDASVSSQPQRSNAALSSRQRNTILGTYERTVSGEEAVQWLSDNLEGLGGDWDRCIEAATELYRLGYLSRVGVGRGFDARYDTYYTLKPNPSASTLTSLPTPLSPATSGNIQSMIKSYLPSNLAPTLSPRLEATKADEAYREGVRVVEARRLEMEERIERGMRAWERWERERLGIVKSVLAQYDQAISKIPARLGNLTTSAMVEAFNPDADLKALIEGDRTGPYRPQAFIYESIESDVPEVNFGIDLRRWSGEFGWKGMVNAPKRPRGAIPDVLTALLGSLSDLYENVDPEERRRAWIYEVPLHETHALRNSINASRASTKELTDVIKRYNAPVVAGTIKLYLLELNPPVLGWEGWEDAKAVYPAVGADLERDVESALSSVLSRMPGVSLFVLDAVVRHLRDLVDKSPSAEDDEIYVTKLSLSLGRCMMRPQFETELTIGDRTPSLFLADLVTHYAKLFPSLVEKKKVETERVMPIRKRTALVDQRISRSRLSEESDPQALLEQQHSLARLSLTSAPRAEESRATSTQNGSEMIPPAASTPTLTTDDKPPFMQDPEDDEASPERAVAPLPNPTYVDKPFSPVLPTDLATEEEPPTAAILDSYDQGPEDQPVLGGGLGLKRNTSAEVSRLRGPRGARGPRPAPGRVASHTGPPPPTQLQTMDAEEINERSGGVGIPGDYAPRRGKGATSAGAFGHKSKSSVSAIAAQFEGRQ